VRSCASDDDDRDGGGKKEERQIATRRDDKSRGSGVSAFARTSVKIYYVSYDSLNEAKSAPGVINAACAAASGAVGGSARWLIELGGNE